ncbi:MAG: PD40 domain-containing protein [Bacteroidales bacterium]|nr:PD40 domain-containing protein [Bacteroidales bacterium]
MRKSLFILFFQMILCGLVAQNVEFRQANFPNNTKREFKSAVKNKKMGEKILKAGDYRTAVNFLLKAQQFNPQNAELNYEIASCYEHLSQLSEAVSYAETAYGLDSLVAVDLIYYKGCAHQMRYEFVPAIRYYRRYLSTPGVTREGNLKANQRIKECENGRMLLKRGEIPCKIYILDTTVNGKYDEYGPAVSADDSLLFFTSRRTTKRNQNRGYASDGKYVEKIYRSSRDTAWQKAVLTLGANFRGHMAVQGVSNDGRKVILYKDKRGGDLYESELKGTSFGCAKRLPRCVNSKAHETSASYSYDGNTIYFCSDRSDMGFGGHDIYKVTKDEKGKWKNVENLGNVVNTPDDEITVFAHPDGKTLYFSSRGHDGMGGFDIYVTTLENGKWTKPRNLGLPINTPGDDISFVITANGKNAYYASAQPNGFGEEDIYCIAFKSDKVFVAATEENLLADDDLYEEESEVKEKAMPAHHMTLLNGLTRDKDSHSPLAASIELYDVDSNRKIGDFETNENTGKFLMSMPAGHHYHIKVSAPGYIAREEDFDIPDSSGFQNKEIVIDLESDGSRIPEGLENIEFDFDKSSLQGSVAAERLDRVADFMTRNPQVKVIIAGHTDNMGTDAYNQTLSESRAKTAVDYLVEKGIERSRMTSKGYGKTRPIDTNDTDEGRQHNRRVEFIIVK